MRNGRSSSRRCPPRRGRPARAAVRRDAAAAITWTRSAGLVTAPPSRRVFRLPGRPDPGEQRRDRRLIFRIVKRSSHAGPPASAHLAQDICRRTVPASHRHCPRCLARHCAAFVQRAMAGNGVRAWRDHDRVAAAGADGNVTANAGTRHDHGPGPGARQPWCRAANAVQVTGQGAPGGRLPVARRQARQAHGSQEHTQEGPHFPWTKCACHRFHEHLGKRSRRPRPRRLRPEIWDQYRVAHLAQPPTALAGSSGTSEVTAKISTGSAPLGGVASWHQSGGPPEGA